MEVRRRLFAQVVPDAEARERVRQAEAAVEGGAGVVELRFGRGVRLRVRRIEFGRVERRRRPVARVHRVAGFRALFVVGVHGGARVTLSRAVGALNCQRTRATSTTNPKDVRHSNDTMTGTRSTNNYVARSGFANVDFS